MNFWICHCSQVHIAYCSACRGEMCNREMLSMWCRRVFDICFDMIELLVFLKISPPSFHYNLSDPKPMLAMFGRHVGKGLWRKALWTLTVAAWIVLSVVWLDFQLPPFLLEFDVFHWVHWLTDATSCCKCTYTSHGGKSYAHYCLRFKPCTWQLCTLSSVCMYVCM